MIGALLAKEYADQHRPPIFLLGALTFLALFAVYAYALKLAQALDRDDGLDRAAAGRPARR